MTMLAVIDTSVVVALVDEKDKWHAHAVALRSALLTSGLQVLYFDCVVNEAIGVIGRRAEEQKRSEQFNRLLDELLTLAPNEAITWLHAESERFFPDIITLCREHHGKLNFHDALMAFVCRQLGIGVIVSFDKDFEEVTWLKRVDSPEDVAELSIE